ncbi:MAG: hypothetical protein ACFFAT_10785 [Promethearchaeota archaeon]
MGLFGHLGFALAVKRFTPQIPLWVLLFCSMLIDIPAMIFWTLPLWITHGLIMAIIWSLISMFISIIIFLYLNIKTQKIKNKKSINMIIFLSLVIGIVVFSHWVIDLIGWSMTGNGIPLLFDDSQLLMLNIQIDIIIGLLIMEIGPFIIGLIMYIQYFKKVRKEKENIIVSPTTSP